MNAQQAPTGLRRSERLSKMKKTKNQQSAALSTEASKQTQKSTTENDVKQDKVDEPSEKRTQLLARHEGLKRTTLHLRGRLSEIKRKRKELRLNHPSKSEKFQRILLIRYMVARAAHTCRLFGARLDATVTKWSEGVERHYTNILGPIEQVNDAILKAGGSTTAKPLDLSGAPENQDSTITTDE